MLVLVIEDNELPVADGRRRLRQRERHERDRARELMSGACKLATALVLIGVALCCVAPPAGALSAPNARVSGTFSMRARVTTAVDVAGEHRGEVVNRRWVIAPGGCTFDVCTSLQLDRQRSDDLDSMVTLRRLGSGRYAGRGVFYAPLECRGRFYRDGSRVPYRITLRITATTEIGGIVFAKRIVATYVNRHRSDLTPCPLAPSHDAGVYRGNLTSGLPSAPTAGFTDLVDAATGTVSFTNISSSGGGDSAIVAQTWSFGDPESPEGDSSTLQDPTHTYLLPGSYTVTLVVLDSEGLSAQATQTVIVGPASAATQGRLRQAESSTVASTARSSPTSASRLRW